MDSRPRKIKTKLSRTVNAAWKVVGFKLYRWKRSINGKYTGKQGQLYMIHHTHSTANFHYSHRDDVTVY